MIRENRTSVLSGNLLDWKLTKAKISTIRCGTRRDLEHQHE
jgi:hypothetical protein